MRFIVLISILVCCTKAFSTDLGVKDIRGVGEGCKYLNAGFPVKGELAFDELERLWLLDLMKKGSKGTHLNMFEIDFQKDKVSKDGYIAYSTCRITFTVFSMDSRQKIQYKTNYFTNEYVWFDSGRVFDASAGITVSEVGAPGRSLISQQRITQVDTGLLEFSFSGKQFASRCRKEVKIEMKMSFNLETDPADAATAESVLAYKRFLPLKAKIEVCN